MAKPTAFATPICIGLTVLALIGAALSIWRISPLTMMFFVLPAVGYEVYRVEGAGTKAAAWGLLAVYVAEIICLIFHVNFNIASWLELEETTISGILVPLGDITIVMPIIVAALSIALFVKTWGIYTKWLAVIIFLSSLVVIYLVDPNILQEILKSGAKDAINRL